MKILPFNRARRQQGTASVEVVAMLPFFFILFGGVYWIHGHYMGRQQAMVRARTCAWAYAAAGCQDKDKGKLADCVHAGDAGGAVKDETDPNAAAPTNTPQTEQERGAMEAIGKIVGTLEKIPVLKQAIQWLFGKPTEVTGWQEVAFSRSPISAGGTAQIGGSYHTLCNTVPQGWNELAKSIFCDFVGKFPGCK